VFLRYADLEEESRNRDAHKSQEGNVEGKEDMRVVLTWRLAEGQKLFAANCGAK
jgi:hypothetical protein